MKKFHSIHIAMSALFVTMFGITIFESFAIIMSSYIFFVCLDDEHGSAFLNIASLLAVIHIAIMFLMTSYCVVLDIKERRRKKHDQRRMD
jgi:hypothetical protein